MPGGFNWDDAKDRLLLLRIIQLAAPTLPKWDEVAEIFGGKVTGNAIRQRYQKLRNEAKEQFGEAGIGTPKKGGGKEKADAEGGNAKLSGSKKRKATIEPNKEVDDHDDDVSGDGSEEESPTKTVKIEQQEYFV